MQNLISKLDPEGGRAFFDTARFSWVSEIESNWKLIRAELGTVMEQPDHIPNFQDLSEDQRVLTQGEEWKTFFFYVYGHKAEQNCDRCPETSRLLRRIPGMKSAMFSILAPGKHIPEHCGPYKGVLRYHLGLVIPPDGNCSIRVKGECRRWEEGKSLVFDDSHPHEAWNDASSPRVVLFVDFVRPLAFPFSLMNQAMIWRLSGRPFITGIVDRARKSAVPEYSH